MSENFTPGEAKTKNPTVKRWWVWATAAVLVSVVSLFGGEDATMPADSGDDDTAEVAGNDTPTPDVPTITDDTPSPDNTPQAVKATTSAVPKAKAAKPAVGTYTAPTGHITVVPEQGGEQRVKTADVVRAAAYSAPDIL